MNHMRSVSLILCICLTGLYPNAQINQNFATLSGQEIDMKECPFDPEASAVVLLDKGIANYNDDYALISENHMRIKILKEEGLQYADVSVTYYSEDQFEFIDNIQAVTINFDENGGRQEVKVEKKAIYFKKINQHLSEMTFAFPQARVGSILEYKYRSVMKHYGGLRDWYFQSSIPVCFSAYEFTPAPNLEFTYQVQKSDNYPIVIKKTESTGSAYFEMKNIPGLGNEPYMDSREDYIQKLGFQITKIAGRVGNRKYMSSWNEVARELSADSDFGAELKANLPEEQRLLIATLANKTDVEKMRLIHNYIRNNYQWDRFKRVFADPGLKTLYNKKIGSSSSLNLALINLLKEAGLEVYPMIVSERGNGRINTKIPFLNQFDNTYAAVIIGGKQYYLNVTDPITPAHLVPYRVLNTTGLIIKRSTGLLTEIKDEESKYQSYVYINSVVSDSGGLSGNVHRVSKDYARANRLSGYSGNIDEYIKDLKKGTLNLDIDSFQLFNEKVDTLAFEEKFAFKTGLQSTDDYLFLNLNMFTGFESNPFITKERFSNINFGYKRTIIVNNVVFLPANYSVDALPKSIRLVNSDRTVNFSRELLYSAETGQLIARIKIDFTKSYYSSEEYADIREFYKKMVDLLNEQVVLKKK
jgi:hypothetical protein